MSEERGGGSRPSGGADGPAPDDEVFMERAAELLAHPEPVSSEAREAIWDEIARRRSGTGADSSVIPFPSGRVGDAPSGEATDDRDVADLSPSRTSGWHWIAVATAAALVLGIGIGRQMDRAGAPGSGADPAYGAAVATDPGLYGDGAREHFRQVETLLALVDDGADPVELRSDARDWASGMLTTTRILLDAPLDDPRARELLQDLELVLAQLAALPETPDRNDELRFVNASLESRDLLSRIRAMAD